MARFAFSADEIYEMAEQIERNGAAFYVKAAQNLDAGRPGELLNELARWEVSHEATFKELRAALADKERAAQVFDPDELCSSYLQAFADRHVFDTRIAPSDVLTGKESFEEILRMALDLEKDSIVFYLGLKDATPLSAGKDRIDEIIREEMRHVSVISAELKKALTAE